MTKKAVFTSLSLFAAFFVPIIVWAQYSQTSFTVYNNSVIDGNTQPFNRIALCDSVLGCTSLQWSVTQSTFPANLPVGGVFPGSTPINTEVLCTFTFPITTDPQCQPITYNGTDWYLTNDPKLYNSTRIYDVRPQQSESTTTPYTIQFSYSFGSTTQYQLYSIALTRTDSTGSLGIGSVASSTGLFGSLTSSSGTVTRQEATGDGLWTMKICLQTQDLYVEFCGNSQTYSVGSTTYDQQFIQTFGNINETATTTDFLQLANLFQSLGKKIPFGYAVEVYDLVSSSTRVAQNSATPLVSIKLHDIGLGSTSPVGNFLPNIELSTTTIGHYLTEGTRQTLLGLQDAALWMSLLSYFWRRRHIIV